MDRPLSSAFAGAQIAPYEPTWRDKFRYWMQDRGVNPAIVDRVAGTNLPHTPLGGAADMLPGVGTAFGVQEGSRAFQQGRPVEGALSYAGAAADIIPGAGALLGSKPVRDGAEALADMFTSDFLPSEAGNLRLPAGSGLRGEAKSAADSMLADAVAAPGDNNPPASMYDVPAGSDPRYRGAAPDRNPVSFLRYRSKTTPRVARALDALRDPENPVRKQMVADIETGRGVGEDWYNTEELRDWFIAELGEEQGHAEWSQFMDLIGAASPGSKVPANVRNAAAIRNRMANDPEYVEQLSSVVKLDDARPLGKGRLPGYGHKTQGLQELIAGRQVQGGWEGAPEPGVAPSKGSWAENPKPKGFTNSLRGSAKNIAADLHFTRYMAMASQDPDFLSTSAEIGKDATAALLEANPNLSKYLTTTKRDGKDITTFKAKAAAKDGEFDVTMAEKYPSMWAEKPNDAEYRDFEEFMGELGAELGLTGPQTQAALWMGAADRTGVDVTSQGTFMELMRNVADRRAAETGMTREEVMRDFIRNKGLLALPVGGVGLSGAMFGQEGAPQDGT